MPQQPRLVIVHGWDGAPEHGWYSWLKRTMEDVGMRVDLPQLPHPEEPTIDDWIGALAQAVGAPDEHTYLVGHSMGCQTIVRYLETLPESTTIGGAIFVAGYFEALTGLESAEEKRIARPWMTSPIDYARVRSRLPRAVALFSDNDPYVPLVNTQHFRERLGATTHVLHAMGHFAGDDGIFELPMVAMTLQHWREAREQVADVTCRSPNRTDGLFL